MIASVVLVYCWDGVRLQFTIFIQLAFSYVCSIVSCLSFAKIYCVLVSYLVGLISRYGINVFISRFNISTNYKLRNTAKRESDLI